MCTLGECPSPDIGIVQHDQKKKLNPPIAMARDTNGLSVRVCLPGRRQPAREHGRRPGAKIVVFPVLLCAFQKASRVRKRAWGLFLFLSGKRSVFFFSGVIEIYRDFSNRIFHVCKRFSFVFCFTRTHIRGLDCDELVGREGKEYEKSVRIRTW